MWNIVAAGVLATAPALAQPGSRAAATPSSSTRATPLPTTSAAQSAPSAARVALAERYAEEAFQAYGRKDYPSAVAFYRKALDSAPSADIVYNLARVYDLGLQDRALAIQFYTRYLGEPGAVESRVEMARQRLAELSAAEQQAPKPSAAPPVLPSAPPPVEVDARGGSALPALAITAGALGLVGVGVGVGFGIAAKSRLDVSRRYCHDNSCTTLRGVEAARSAGRAADVATVAFVAGGGLLALGTVLWLVADGEAESRRTSRELDWTPSLAPGEVSLALSGSFAGL
jgi:hypothetical protein